MCEYVYLTREILSSVNIIIQGDTFKCEHNYPGETIICKHTLNYIFLTVKKYLNIKNVCKT